MIITTLIGLVLSAPLTATSATLVPAITSRSRAPKHPETFAICSGAPTVQGGRITAAAQPFGLVTYGASMYRIPLGQLDVLATQTVPAGSLVLSLVTGTGTAAKMVQIPLSPEVQSQIQALCLAAVKQAG